MILLGVQSNIEVFLARTYWIKIHTRPFLPLSLHFLMQLCRCYDVVSMFANWFICHFVLNVFLAGNVLKWRSREALKFVMQLTTSVMHRHMFKSCARISWLLQHALWSSGLLKAFESCTTAGNFKWQLKSFWLHVLNGLSWVEHRFAVVNDGNELSMTEN